MADETLLFSVIICTYNKADVLRENLARLLECSLDQSEVLVVNNCCTDRTGEVCDEMHSLFTGAGVRLKVVQEEQLGLSRARNRGADEASGRYLIYLDDDCLVETDILASYRDAVLQFPDCVLAGGTIIPRWPDGSAPAWLPPALFWVYGAMNYDGNVVRPLQTCETVNGGNFLVRKDALAAVGGFDATLGNVGNHLRGAEEQNAVQRIQRDVRGSSLCIPGAVVTHHFPLDRLTERYVAERLRQGSLDRAVSDYRTGRKAVLAARSAYYMLKLVLGRKSLMAHKYRGYVQGALGSLKHSGAIL